MRIKHTATILALYLLMASMSYSQNDARILGGIDTGEPSSPAPVEFVPVEMDVQSVHVLERGGRTITSVRVAPPLLPGAIVEPQAYEMLTREEQEARQSRNGKPELHMVSAWVVEGKGSFVRWWHAGEEYTAWSNVNFHYLGGFHDFEGRGRHYIKVMSVGYVSAESSLSPPELPGVEEQGPVYAVVKGDIDNEEAFMLMDVLHDIYEIEEIKLKEAYALREERRKEREEYLKANPPLPQDRTLYYWPVKNNRITK